jgi:hypothetical protein
MPKVFTVNNRVIGTLRAFENQLGTVTEVINEENRATRYQVTFDNGRVEVVTNRAIDIHVPPPQIPINQAPIQAFPGIDNGNPDDESIHSSDSSDSSSSNSSVSTLLSLSTIS